MARPVVHRSRVHGEYETILRVGPDWAGRHGWKSTVENASSVRQVAHDLHDRGIPSPTGKPALRTSTLPRLLRNEAYIGRVYYNRRKAFNGAPAHRGAGRTPDIASAHGGVDHDLGAGNHRAEDLRARREQQAREPQVEPAGIEPGH
jgi:Recombinase